MSSITALNARWVLPMQPASTVLPQHTLIIQDEQIADLLPEAQARQRYPQAYWLDFPNHALLPGLVNAHTHAAMSLFRGLGSDRSLHDWLQSYIWPAEAKYVDEDFVTLGSQLAIAEMLRSGTTCFNDMYLFPEATARVVQHSGIRAVLGLIVIEFPTQWAKTAQDYFERGNALFNTWQGYSRLHFALAPHAPYTVSDASLREILELAQQREIPIHMHVHETQQEVESALHEHQERPLARLQRLGLLDHPFAAVHMTQLTPDEQQLLRDHPLVSVVHCPESNLKLASGFCPVAELYKHNITVALGTDGAASNNDLDMLGEMRTAALLAKGVAGDATALNAIQALEMATLKGARALGLEDRIGSLTPGKYADVIAIDLSSLECLPTHDPHTQIVYAATREDVSDVFVAGRQLLSKRQLTTMDEHALRTEVQAWHASHPLGQSHAH